MTKRRCSDVNTCENAGVVVISRANTGNSTILRRSVGVGGVLSVRMIEDVIRTGGLGSLWEAPSVKGINKEACGDGLAGASLPSDRNHAIAPDSVLHRLISIHAESPVTCCRFYFVSVWPQ